MDDVVNSELPPDAPTPRHARWEPGTLVVLVEGACAAVVGAYVATGSVAVTLITAVVALAVVTLVVLIAHR